MGLVSVLIPVYNDEEYLNRALSSVENQTYDEIEAIVIDSGNSETAKKICENYEFCRYYRDKPRGVAAARNVGIDKSRGEFIAFLDADDIWLPRKLEKQVTALCDQNSDFVFSQEYRLKNNVLNLYEGINHISEDFYIKYFKMGGGIGCRTVVVTKKALEVERFWEELDGREDPHLWVRLLAQFDSVKINQPLAIKSIRDNSLTSNTLMMAESEMKSVNDLVERYPELRKYKQERLNEVYYSFGHTYFLQGEIELARDKLRKAGFIRNNRLNIKVLAIYILTFIPLYRKSVYELLSCMTPSSKEFEK